MTHTLEGESDRPITCCANLASGNFAVRLARNQSPSPPEDEETEQEAEERRQRGGQTRRDLRKNLPGYRKRDEECWIVRESGTLSPRFPAGRESLSVCFDPRFRLEGNREALWSVKSEHGVHALTHAHGKGRVTVLTDHHRLETRPSARPIMQRCTRQMAIERGTSRRIVFPMPREDRYEGILSHSHGAMRPAVSMVAVLTVLALYAGARALAL